MQMRINTLLLGSVIAATAACGGGGDDSEPAYSGSTKTVSVTNRAEADALVGATACTLFTCSVPRLRASGTTANDSPGIGALPLPPDRFSSFKTTRSDCPKGGTRTITESEAGFVVGYSSTVEYDQCAQYNRYGGFRQDGSYGGEVTAMEGVWMEPGEWSYTTASQYHAYRFDNVDGSGRTLSYSIMHGEMIMTRSGWGTEESAWDIRYPQFYTKADYGTPIEILMRNSRRHVESSLGFNPRVGVDGNICSTAIGGCVTLHTPAHFNFPDGFAFAPDAGQMVITGADGARVRVTVLDATQVTIEYDVDPVDGTYEDSQSTTWDALQK